MCTTQHINAHNEETHNDWGFSGYNLCLAKLPTLFGLLFVLIFSFSSCNTSKYLANGEALYKDSKVEWAEDEAPDKTQESPKGNKIEFDSDYTLNQLGKLDKQKPNKKFLGIIPFRLWVYNQLSVRKEGFLKSWLDNGRGSDRLKNTAGGVLYPEGRPSLRSWFLQNIGQAPVLYDTSAVLVAADKMQAYITNLGYFHPEVLVEHKITKNGGIAKYKIDLGERHFIRKISWSSTDSLIQFLAARNYPVHYLNEGDAYTLSAFKAERIRIRDILQDHGYFGFDRNYVEFELDSTIEKNQIDIHVVIRNPGEGDLHQRYSIGNVLCYPEFQSNFINPDAAYDTVVHENVYIISRTGRFKPNILSNAIFIEPNKLYNQSNHALSIRKLNELGAFKFVSIQYQARTDSVNILDAIVRLQPMRKQVWSVELNANTNFGTQIGSDLDFSYRNRNLFRNADLFTFNLSSGLETQIGEGETFIRNLDLTGQANLTIPKFVVPFKLPGIKALNPTTLFEARYTYTRRIEYYTLNSTVLSLGYQWRRNSKIQHLLRPIDISLVQPSVTDLFQSILDENFLLTQSFQRQLLPGTSYSFLFSDNSVNKSRSGIYFRGTGELAGNIINATYDAFETSAHGANGVAGIPIAQFTRFFGDFRYFYRRTDEEVLVFRLAGGVGLSYGNSAAMPFVKQFYAGGPSSIRAWRVRRLGPGSFSGADTSEVGVFIDQTGDIHLESNVEYRFPIYKLVKGAIFLDAGNIWLRNEDENRPGAKFESDFYTDIAIGTGLGLRLDFDFFIF
ncbi:MAG: outer membrane protein insertion porin family, partial [Limisphaerales bacterium]